MIASSVAPRVVMLPSPVVPSVLCVSEALDWATPTVPFEVDVVASTTPVTVEAAPTPVDEAAGRVEESGSAGPAIDPRPA